VASKVSGLRPSDTCELRWRPKWTRGRSEACRRDAIAGCAKLAGVVIVESFYDAAVGGADAIEAALASQRLLRAFVRNSIGTIIVARVNRFARDPIVQEVGFAMQRDLGVLIAAIVCHPYRDDRRTSKLIRKMFGASSEFDKATIVA
jgi:hypothetical protein